MFRPPRIFSQLLSLALMLFALLGASPSSAADWARNYGTTGANSQVQATKVDAAGNVYIAGYFRGATLALGSVTLTKKGNYDAFVAKLDAGGTVLWAQNFGGSGAIASGMSIATDMSGNVYLGGNFNSANLTTPALTKIGGTDAFALKLDASGNTVWAKNFGGSGTGFIKANMYGNAIAADASGNVYLGGYFNNVNLTTPALTKIGSTDAFALKLDASGNTVWAKNFGGSTASASGTGIAVDASGNAYLGGYFYSGNLTTPALTQIVTTLYAASDAFALKLDASGNTVWAQNFGGSGAGTRGTAIALDTSGNVYLGGYFYSGNLTTPALTLIGAIDTFALKLDAATGTIGANGWAKNFGGSGGIANAYGSAIALDASGNVYLGGYLGLGNLTAPALTKIGNNDAFALKLDASGNTLWAQNFGGSGGIANAYGNGIAADASGNVYLGGYFDSANLTTPALTLIGSRDALIIKAATTAIPVTSYTGTTATNSGPATATVVSGGGAGCGFTGTPQFVPPSSPPAGVTFPHGLFNFTLGGCTPGSTVTLAVTYPSAVPAGTQYWKYGRTAASPTTPIWYAITPTSISGNTVTFTVTDGGLGDDDLLANGTIVDPGGVGVQGAATAIPTLSEWGMILLAGLLGLFGVGVMWRRQFRTQLGMHSTIDSSSIK